MIGAARGYRVTLTLPECVSLERRHILEAFGAEVVPTPACEGTDGAIRKAHALLAEEGEKYFMPNQFANEANILAHYETTGPEIWRQTDGTVTHWVAGIGTGGTISGVARYLKEQNPDIRAGGIDTVGSIYEYYFEHRELPPEDQIHQYLTDGIGEDFLPECVWWDHIDEVITIDDKTAYKATMDLARQEGIFCGSSSGSAAAGARQVAEKLGDGARVVTLFPDSGERYLSKLNDEWMGKHGLL